MVSLRDVVHSQARYHEALIRRALRQVHCRSEPLGKDVVLAGLEALLAKHPMQGATREQAAVHEAAHLVFDEAAGMGPTTAKIFGTPGFSRGWGGEARAMGARCFEQTPERHDPIEFLRDARQSVAGTVAEELIAGGDALSSIGELVQAWAYVYRASELWGCDHAALWRKTLSRAVALMEHYGSEIRDIAKVLDRRRRIFDSTPSVRKILPRVWQTPVELRSVSERGVALARKIEDATSELAR